MESLIRSSPVKFWIETDASLQGWGLDDKISGGRCTNVESTYHINYLELLSIFNALKALCANSNKCHIGIKSDNSTAVSYINNMGGMTSEALDELACKIWLWCLERDIFISAQHIPGDTNVQADTLSRNFSDNLEWKLKEDIFKRICHHYFIPNIDLFATRHNTQLERFASWHYDPDAVYTDAFSCSWSDVEPYIFPPFSLIGKVINKIFSDNVQRAILIVPFWPTQNWFPLLISALICNPTRLPKHKDLLYMPLTAETHPLSGKIVLVACVVSGVFSKIKDFQELKPPSSCLHGSLPQSNNMESAFI